MLIWSALKGVLGVPGISTGFISHVYLRGDKDSLGGGTFTLNCSSLLCLSFLLLGKIFSFLLAILMRYVDLVSFHLNALPVLYESILPVSKIFSLLPYLCMRL